MIGYGSAIAVSVFLLSLALALIYLRGFKTTRLEGTRP
jgi:ABC-type sugar transport system permease subunit